MGICFYLAVLWSPLAHIASIIQIEEMLPLLMSAVLQLCGNYLLAKHLWSQDTPRFSPRTMGDIVKFQLENDPSFVNIFIPSNCNWKSLNDLVQIRFNLAPEDTIHEILVLDNHTKKNVGKISSNDSKINIPFASFCIVKLLREGAIASNQIPTSPISKIPITPMSRNSSNSFPLEPSPIVAPSSPHAVTPIISKPVFDEHDSDEEEDTGNTLLHDSCILGHLQYVTTLVQSAQDVDLLNKKRQTPFMLACLHGHLEVAKVLAKGGANVFAEDEAWCSALHFAAQSGDVDLVDWLIKDVNHDRGIANRRGQTPLDIAKLYQQEDLIRYFVGPQGKLSPRNSQAKTLPQSPRQSPRSKSNSNAPSFQGGEEVEEEEEEEEEEEKNEDIEDEDEQEISPPATSPQFNNEVTAGVQAVILKPSQNLTQAESAFLQACLSGDKSLVTQYLESNGNPHCCNENGSQGIHFVAARGDLDLLRLLLRHGVDVDTLNNNNCTALHFACQYCHTNMIKWLISEGNSNVFIENTNSMTPIHILCGTADGYEALVWFIETQRLYFNEFIQQNQLSSYPSIKTLLTSKLTLLHAACTSSNGKMLSCLLEHGFDITLQDHKSHNILHIACNENNYEAVKLICSNASNVKTLLDVPVEESNITPVFYACLCGSYSIVKYLQKFNPDLSIRNIRGNTCLHAACQSGSLRLVKYLLKKGCSLQVVNYTGFWPYDFAIKTNSNELINFLKEIKAINSTLYQELVSLCLKNDVRGLKQWIHEGYDLIPVINILGCENKDISPPSAAGAGTGGAKSDKEPSSSSVSSVSLLHQICYHGAYDVFHYLSQLPNFNLNTLDQFHRTPLHVLCMSKSPYALQIFDLFLTLGMGSRSDGHVVVDLDPIDSMGFTPFFYACQSGNLFLAQKLVNTGCNIYHRGGLHDPLTTALHLSTAHGHFEIVKWLTESGLNIFALNENENTPIDISKFEGYQEIYQWFVTQGSGIHEDRLNSTLLPQIVWAIDSNHFKFASCAIKEVMTMMSTPPSPRDAATSASASAASAAAPHDIQHFISELDGSTLLHYACGAGDLELTSQLIEQKHCDVMITNHAGHTAFHSACLKGHVSIVDYLRKQCHVKLTLKDHTSLGNSGFHYACQFGHVELLKYYCQEGLVNMINAEGFHGLHYLCQYGHVDLLEILLEYHQQSMNINCVTSSDQMTPLHLACYYQWDEVIILLMSKTKACDLELEDRNHMTVPHLISLIGYKPLIDWLEIVMTGPAVYPTYEVPIHFKRRGKRLRLPNHEDEAMSESETSEDHHHNNSQHSFHDHSASVGSNSTSYHNSQTFSPNSLFFCLSDTSTSAPLYSSLSAADQTHTPVIAKAHKSDQLNRSSHHSNDKSSHRHRIQANSHHDSDSEDLQTRSSHALSVSSIDASLPSIVPPPVVPSSSSNRKQSQSQRITPGNHEHYLSLHKSLFEAIENNNYDLFLEIFQENKDKIDMNYSNPLTLNNIFHVIAKNNSLQILQYLIANASNTATATISNTSSDATSGGNHCPLNLKNINSLTPLHIACEEGYTDLIRTLLSPSTAVALSCCVDLNIANNKSQTPMTILIQKKNLTILKEIEHLLRQEVEELDLDMTHLSPATQQSYLHLGITTKSSEIIETLCHLYELTNALERRRGARRRAGTAGEEEDYMNQVDCDGKSPLHYACQFCSYNVITFLLSHASDISLLDNHHCPPVYYAVIAGNLKIVQLLLEKYNNLHCLNDKGDSLLHVACNHSRLVIAKWFVTKGLDMKLLNHDGLTPIDYSQQSNNKGMMEWAKTFI
jgi:ankyrin repeat protein